jgi:hypothetical protein
VKRVRLLEPAGPVGLGIGKLGYMCILLLGVYVKTQPSILFKGAMTSNDQFEMINLQGIEN